MGWSQEKVRIGEFVDARNLDMKQVDQSFNQHISFRTSELQSDLLEES